MSTTDLALAALTSVIVILAVCNVLMVRLAHSAVRTMGVRQSGSSGNPTNPHPNNQSAASGLEAKRTTLFGLPRKYAIPAFSGYGVVLMLGAVYVLLYFGSRYTNAQFGWPEASQRDAAIVAAILATPLAVSFLWDRISKVKILEFELDLSSTKPQVALELADQMKSVDLVAVSDSGGDEIKRQVETAINHAKSAPLIQVTLERQQEWWSTRLYLLAALAADYTEVQRIVFVEQRDGHERYFVGLATPLATRQALARVHQNLELAYRAGYAQAVNPALVPAGGTPPAPQSAEQLDLTMTNFGHEFTARLLPGQNERAVRQVVTAGSLQQWLGAELKKPQVETAGGPISELTYWEILNQEEAFVALVQGGHLRQMVDRLALAIQVARDVVRSKLNPV